jgi:hypothetical protein
MALREIINLEAKDARRERLRKGQLLGRREFRERLAVTEARFERMIVAGSVFAVDVDGVEYFPALLAEPTVNRRRLQSLCRILVPAPAWCRLDYLESKHANLGDVTALELLSDNVGYQRLREIARAWASEWSRTIVTLFEGAHDEEPTEVNPIFTTTDEVDPRIDLWTRANGAFQVGGCVTRTVPCVAVRDLTIFVKRHDVGDSPAILEARLQVRLEESVAHVCIQTGGVHSSDLVIVEPEDDAVEIVHRIVKRRIKSQMVLEGSSGRYLA